MSQRVKVTESLTELAALDRADLGEQWTSLMKRPPPKAASRVFLLRALSYELQCQRAPSLSKADQTVLSRSISGQGDRCRPQSGPESIARLDPSDRAAKPAATPRMVLVPGSRLVREWNGRPYTVSVIEEGFVYKDKVWSSLSAIAKDITGAHWSGPRFFGLNRASP
jgi:hypothetical protein